MLNRFSWLLSLAYKSQHDKCNLPPPMKAVVCKASNAILKFKKRLLCRKRSSPCLEKSIHKMPVLPTTQYCLVNHIEVFFAIVSQQAASLSSPYLIYKAIAK